MDHQQNYVSTNSKDFSISLKSRPKSRKSRKSNKKESIKQVKSLFDSNNWKKLKTNTLNEIQKILKNFQSKNKHSYSISSFGKGKFRKFLSLSKAMNWRKPNAIISLMTQSQKWKKKTKLNKSSCQYKIKSKT